MDFVIILKGGQKGSHSVVLKCYKVASVLEINAHDLVNLGDFFNIP